MSDKSAFEIPKSMRALAEQSLDQAKNAYDRWMEANQKAQQMLAQSSEAMTASAKDVQAKAAAFAEENIRASFDLAENLVKAKDFNDALQIQSAFARERMEAYSKQAQELTRLMSATAKKAQPE